MSSSALSKYLRTIPVAPHVATQIVRLAQQKGLTYETLYQALCIDPGLTAQVLRIANSPRFAQEGQVLDLRAAINLIGFTTVKNLVLLTSRSSTVPPHHAARFYDLFWNHSTLSAAYAKDLALLCGFSELADQAFVGGLLHNLGQLVLFRTTSGYPELVDGAETRNEPIGEAEERVLGTTHHEAGFRVFQEWRFPAVYADVVREHGHRNITSEHKLTILLVSVGSFIASNVGPRKRDHSLDRVEHSLPFLGISRSALEDFQERCRRTFTENPWHGPVAPGLIDPSSATPMP